MATPHKKSPRGTLISPPSLVKSHTHVVAPNRLSTSNINYITRITSFTRVVIILDDHEHKLIQALEASTDLLNNKQIAWITQRLPVGDIAIYVLADTAIGYAHLNPPLLNVYPVAIYERKTYLDLVETIKNAQRRANISSMQLTCDINNAISGVIFEQAMKIHNGTTTPDGELILKKKLSSSQIEPQSVLGYINGISSRMATMWTTTPANTLASIARVAIKALGTARSPFDRFKTVPLPIPVLNIKKNYTSELTFHVCDKRPHNVHGVTLSINKRSKELVDQICLLYHLEFCTILIGGQLLYYAFVDETNIMEDPTKISNVPDTLPDLTEFPGDCIDSTEYLPFPNCNTNVNTEKILDTDKLIEQFNNLDMHSPSPSQTLPNTPVSVLEKPRRKKKFIQKQIESPVCCGIALKLVHFELINTGTDISNIAHIIGGHERFENKYVLYRDTIIIDDTTSTERIQMVPQLWTIAELAVKKMDRPHNFTGLTLTHLLFYRPSQQVILAQPNLEAHGTLTSLEPKLPTMPVDFWDRIDQHYLFKDTPFTSAQPSNSLQVQEQHYLREVKHFIYMSIGGLVLMLRIFHAWPDKIQRIRQLESRFAQPDSSENSTNYILDIWRTNYKELEKTANNIAWFLDVPSIDLIDIINQTLIEINNHEI